MQTTRERLATLCFDEENPLSPKDMQDIIQCWIEENNRTFQAHCKSMAISENFEFLQTIYTHKLQNIDSSIVAALHTYLLDFLSTNEISQTPDSCSRKDFQLLLDTITDETISVIFNDFFIKEPEYLNVTDKNSGIVDNDKCRKVFATGNKLLQIAVLLDVKQQLEKLLVLNVRVEKFMVQGQIYLNAKDNSNLVGNSLFPAVTANPATANKDKSCCCTLF